MSTKKFNKTLIIGLGLIGGSFARACKINNISEAIYAFDLDSESIAIAVESHIIDGFITLDENLFDFDFIILATPLATYKDIIKKIAPKISDQTILIDLGSVKEVEIKTKILPQNLRENFIPCHPIAGSEKTGFENASDDLFFGKKFIICPENTNESALLKIENLVKKIGGEVEFLEAKKHNEIYALVSHLPQFLSFLTAEFSPKNITDDFFKNAFRLNNSSPEIWGEIFKLNEENIEKFYLEFFDNLEEFAEQFEQKKFLEILQDIEFYKKEVGKEIVKQAQGDAKTFLEENFSSIFFRLIIVASYLNISDIKNFQSFAGSGFKDFTSITTILNLEENKLINLMTKNQKKILKLFESLME